MNQEELEKLEEVFINYKKVFKENGIKLNFNRKQFLKMFNQPDVIQYIIKKQCFIYVS